jgi:hypothetical protein
VPGRHGAGWLGWPFIGCRSQKAAIRDGGIVARRRPESIGAAATPSPLTPEAATLLRPSV